MKTYPYSTGTPLPVHLRRALKKVGLSLLFISIMSMALAQSGSGGGSGSSSANLRFKDAQLISGTAGQDGAIYNFPQVASDVDARVKITSRSNSLVYLVNIDMVSSGFDKAWQPQVGYNNGNAPGAADWWMEFEISFVEKGTSTAKTIDEFNLSAIDIDGNGHLIREYVSFYGLTSYTLEANSILNMTDLTAVVGGVTKLVGKRFDGPTLNFTNIDTSGTTVMTTARYLNTQKFSVRVGAVSTGASGASERMYSLYFQSFRYNQPQQATLPVKLKSFDASLSSGTAVLNWVAETEERFSHYVVEKSGDGQYFSDLTVIFSNGKTGTDVKYAYSESLGQQSHGLVYYRLKMVDTDGSFRYSPVRILKVHSRTDDIVVSTYPNPVVSELRITIPPSWQEQKVVYDMYSTSGKIIKRIINNKASQTETINMSDVQAGTYVVKLSSSSGSAVQQIVKSR